MLALDDPRFGSGSDDDKLTAALSYLAQQSAKQTLMLSPDRSHTFTKPGRQPFSGLRIDGGAPEGKLTLEIAGTVPYRINVNTGGPWWDSTGLDVHTCWFGNLACQYGGGSYFWRSNYGVGRTAPYPIVFHHHGHFGGAGGFGTYAEKCTFTQAVFSGGFHTMGFTDTPYHLGGADMDLWLDGEHNIESQKDGAGKPILWMDYLSNSHVGSIYLTSPKGWRGVRVDGAVAETKGCACSIDRARIEGHNTSLPAYGRLLEIRGGQVSLRDVKVAWPMTAPDPGEAPIMVSGDSDASFDGLCYDQWNYTGPMAVVSGGTARFTNCKSITKQPMVVRVDGGTVTTDKSLTRTPPK
jgi:hypothetical protein